MTDRLTSTGSERGPVAIDSAVAHTSRVYDYLLGGTDNFAVDREVARHAFAAYPGGLDGARADARAHRAFLGRAVRYLADEVGIRQFLDIGTGIPSADNTHEVAQRISPEARVVYVDNDPIVLAHAHALLHGAPEGATAYLDGDLRDPAAIVGKAAAVLDVSRPVAAVLTGVLHVIPESDRPHDCVAALLDALPSGSYLVVSHMTDDVQGADMAVVAQRLEEHMRTTNPPALRNRADVARFLSGLDIVEPGVVPVADWRPEPATSNGDRVTPLLGAVGRKP